MSISEDIEKKLDELFSKITPEDLSWVDDMEKILSLFIFFDKRKEFLYALECIERELNNNKSGTDDGKLRKIRNLIIMLKKSESDFLIENLKRAGYNSAKDQSLKEAINKELLRILELIRLGKKDAVIGMIMRNFTIRGKKMPQELIEALKPKYDINLFRAFMYAFLSGFMTTEE